MATDRAEKFGATVAAQIRAELAAADLSVSELARRTRINRETLSRWVKGERALTMPTLFRIAEVLGMDPHLIVLRAEERFEADDARPSHPSIRLLSDDAPEGWEEMPYAAGRTEDPGEDD